MIDPIVAALLSRLDELKESILEQPASDFPSYRERVGYYNGLRDAVAIVTSLYEQDENDF
jgi:hypothetical protein